MRPETRAVIRLAEPDLGGNESAYLKECIDTGWVSSGGPFVERFEHVVAETLGARQAVAVVNGTAALHAALRAVGVEDGDEVLVPALTFVASANAVAYCGARPVFMDIDAASWGLDIVKAREFVETECVWRNRRLWNRITGRPVRAMLPVHVLGHPADVDPLADLARRFDLKIVEDACEALGARYKSRPSGRLGDLGCLSFNGNKVVTAGGGGVVISDDEALARRVRHLTTQARQPSGEYVHDDVGYNYRLTNVCAAVGVAQMERLGEFLARKAAIAARYRSAFAGVAEIHCMPVAPWAEPSHWLFTIRLGGAARGRADALIGHLAAAAIEARRLWRPLHLLPMYRNAQAYRVELAEAVYADAVSLPSSVGLRSTDQDEVIQRVTEFVSGHG